MHANSATMKASQRMLRLIVTGPTKYNEPDFLTLKLNQITFQYDDVVLITGQQPGKDHLPMFPQAEQWFQKKWKKGWRGYKTILRHYPLYAGAKQYAEGMQKMRMEMIQAANALIAFWDVGGTDHHTEELMRLAEVFDLKQKVFRV